MPQKYAAHAGLLPLIRFHADVRAVRPAGGASAATASAEPGAAGWVVEWAGGDGAARADPFDYVIIATGLFNTPERPAWAEGLARCAGLQCRRQAAQLADPGCSRYACR